MGSGFSFAVLGPVRAWQDGSEIDLGSPQQRAVLAVLLLRAGAHVSAESLVDALWSEDPPRSAVGTIRTYIYRLRRLLGGEENHQVGGERLRPRRAVGRPRRHALPPVRGPGAAGPR
jgi:DNA-binding SARP family transcriptional activator